MKKELIIMTGLPGSGKSHIRKKMFFDFKYIDCDELKAEIKGYDPQNPGAVHAQSKVLEKKVIYDFFNEGISFVYDTTASNSDKVVNMTKEAQSLGYEVTIVYVKVSLATSLKRNSERTRVVPESLILKKYALMDTSIQIIQSFADKFVTIENE